MAKAEQATFNLECPGLLGLGWRSRRWKMGKRTSWAETLLPLYLHPSLFYPYPQGGGEGGEEGKRREREREERGKERGRRRSKKPMFLQLAAILLCKFAVIRENLSIFAVIKKDFAAIKPLGDFDMRPYFHTCFGDIDFTKV